MGSRRTSPEASRGAILEAARQCFSDKGLAGTSMSDIATRADVTQSLIHHHFGAKDALWRQVLREAFGRYAAEHAEAGAAQDTTDDPKEHLRAWLVRSFRFLNANPELLRLMSWAQLQQADALTDVLAGLRGQALAQLRIGQTKGIIRGDVPAEHILTIFLGLARTWFEERNLVVDEADPAARASAGAAYLQAAWQLFEGGIVGQADAEPGV